MAWLLGKFDNLNSQLKFYSGYPSAWTAISHKAKVFETQREAKIFVRDRMLPGKVYVDPDICIVAVKVVQSHDGVWYIEGDLEECSIYNVPQGSWLQEANLL
jgi:hypothetical protein